MLIYIVIQYLIFKQADVCSMEVTTIRLCAHRLPRTVWI